MDDKEIFDIVRENYASANADYITEQIRIASQNIAKKESDQNKTLKNALQCDSETAR